MAKQNSHHVVPSPKGGWDVKKSGGERASLHTPTKQDAVDKVEKLAGIKGRSL